MKIFKIIMVMGVLAFGTAANAVVADFNLDFAGISGGDLTGITGIEAFGTDISIDVLSVSGADGMADGDVLEAEITNGLLNFDTDARTFVITGGVTSLGIDEDATVLFVSSAYDWTFTSNAFMDTFTAGGTGLAGSVLLTALNEPDNANPFAFGGFSIESGDGVLNSTDFMATSLGNRTPEVPVPAAAWLFGSGLLGLMGVARRKA